MREFLRSVAQSVTSTRNKVVAASATGLMLVSTSSHAALAADVKSAIQGGFTDANEAAGLLVIGFAGLFAVMLVVKLFRR